jgi:4-amino-4-deoxy-L-arabinose transferase-like glycosyltransferase
MRKLLLNTNAAFALSLAFICACLAWFCLLTPNWSFVSFTNSRMKTTSTSSPMIPMQENETNGIFWLSLKNKSQLVAADHYIMRTRGCIDNITINGQDTPLLQPICNSSAGTSVDRAFAAAFKKDSEWYFSGRNFSPHYGVLIDKDWKDPKVFLGVLFLSLLVAFALFLKLPLAGPTEKFFAIGLFLFAFYLRYYFIFVTSPPEMTIFSDMNAYFRRALDFSTGNYSASQIFQPIGFSIWSWLVRSVGNWELFNWAQLFLSWGTAYLVFLIALRHVGRIAAFAALFIASIHMPQIAFASLHMAETLYAFLLTLSLWWLLRIRSYSKLWTYSVAGFLLVLSFYVKGTHSFFFPLFGLWILWKNRHDWRLVLKKNLAFAVGCLFLIVPHMIWTQQALGKMAWAPRAGALNFIEGKCPWKDNIDSRGERWMSPLFVYLNETTVRKWNRPFSDDKYFWKQGFQCVTDRPMVLVESVRYIYYLAAGNPLWPTQSVDRDGWMGPWQNFFFYFLLPMTFFGVLIRRPHSDHFYEMSLLLILSLFISAWFFKSENRFRVPFDGVLILWGAWAVEYILVACGMKVALYLLRDWQLKRSAE